MRLTSFTDYALRLLMMIEEAQGHLVTIEQAAARYRISRPNLMKVANELTKAGLLTGIRGRSGGLKLAKPATSIRIGDIVRVMEPDFALVECFGTGNECVIAGFCQLPRALRRATEAFLAELDQTSLADISIRPRQAAAMRAVPDEIVTGAMEAANPLDDTDSVIIEEHSSAPAVSSRQAKMDETRQRILQAFAECLGSAGGEDVSFDVLARKAGVERRTVFRHFPSKADLLKAFWFWIGSRVGPQILPETLEDLLALPRQVFPGFDRHEAIIRASLHSQSGRDMRAQALPARRAAFAAIAARALPGSPKADQRKFEALSHLLVSAAAWETLKDYAGLSGAEAGQIVSDALERLLVALRSPPVASPATAIGS